MKGFLRSAESGPKFSETDFEAVSLSRQLKKFRCGELQHSESRRKKTLLFPDVQAKLIAYLKLRAHYYKHVKCGVSFSLLRAKAAKFADDLGIIDVKASSAHKLGVNEAAMVHLDRFIRALHSSNAKKAKQDTTLHVYFNKK